ncbi:MAG: type II secretion system F family protein [Thermoplasmata archaeon]|nr:type II secretion system F family protein [Thermoplasmata archaeon]
MAATKEEMRSLAIATKRDHTRTVIVVGIAIFSVFMLLGILNLTNQVDMSFKKLELLDNNDDGVIDKWDANVGYDAYDLEDTNNNGIIDEADVDGIPDQGQSPMMRFLNFLFLGLAFLFGPWAFYASAKAKNIEAIEKRIPDFLRDVAEAGRFGMTLADAIVVASSGRYGKLTPEIQKMAAQIEWGVTATEALRLFAERMNTALVNRVVAIVIKASDAGGSVADVLTMVAHDTKEEQLTQQEREIAMSTYLAVIYIAFFVFLVTIIILNATFLPKIRIAGMAVARAAEAAGLGSSSVGGMSLDVSVIPQIEVAFFLASMIHAVGDGVMAGVLQNGRVSDGLKHSFILIFLGIIILTLT